VYSEIVGAELIAGQDGRGTLPLQPEHEHVIFVALGSAKVAGTALGPGSLLYLGTGRERAEIAAPEGSRLILLGGVPLGEQLLMWWNFVARTPEEIAAAAADWRDGRFGTVADYDGEPMPAPPLARLRR
jgi:redox-sensitive bicupin YhaK (pirin superfamily)